MSVLRRWIANVLWIIVFGVLFFVCIRSLGDTAAYIVIPTLIVTTIVVWIVTDRRYERTRDE